MHPVIKDYPYKFLSMKKPIDISNNLKILLGLLESNFICFVRQFRQEGIVFCPSFYKNEFRHFNKKLFFHEIFYIFLLPHRKWIFSDKHKYKYIVSICYALARKLFYAAFRITVEKKEKYFIRSYFLLKERYNLIGGKIYERTKDFKPTSPRDLFYSPVDNPMALSPGIYVIYNREEYVLLEIDDHFFNQ